MLAGQYKNKHIVTQFNFSSLVLESEAITPLELVLQDNIVNLTYMAGDLGIGYRIVKKPKFEFDALLGMKLMYFRIGLKTKLAGIVPIEGERDKLWVDPVIGLQGFQARRLAFGLGFEGDAFKKAVKFIMAL